MKYEIICTLSAERHLVRVEWIYKVKLWHGQKSFRGEQEYKTHAGAERAAKATGAVRL